MDTAEANSPNSPNTDDSNDPPNDSVQPSMTYSGGMPGHMYLVTNPLMSTPLRSKRRQVKNACTNCQKACKKCDDARPCLRCTKYCQRDECVDSQRKERKKGIKRGPYKKRDGKDRAGNSVEQTEVPSQQGSPASNGMPTPATTASPPLGFMPFHPSMFPPQYPPPPGARPDGPPYPGFVMVPTYMPAPANGGQEAEGSYMAHPQFTHPAMFFPPYAQYPHPYMMRPDGQMPISAPHYYAPIYARPPSTSRTNDPDVSANQHVGRGGENPEGGNG